MKYFPLIWANLMRRKVRTIFTLLSVFVAFMLFAVLGAVNQAFTGGVQLAADLLGDRRLGVSEFYRGSGKRAEPGHRHERPEQLRFH